MSIIPRLPGLVQGSFAAGINTVIVHGFPYTGNYPGTTWPGYSPFVYQFSEILGPRTPTWRHINDSLLYTARTAYVIKSGTPRVNLAFYWFAQTFSAYEIYGGADFRAAGFSALQPDFHNTDGGAALVNFAREGLLIFVFMSDNDFGPDVLAAVSVNPRIGVLSSAQGSAAQLYTTCRSDATEGLETAFLYNRGAADVFRLSVNAQPGSRPWTLDAWTGVQAPLAIYTRENNSIVVDLELKQGQTALLGFTSSQSVFGIVGSDNRLLCPARCISSAQGEIQSLDAVQLPVLIPWTQISGLETISRVGVYTTEFTISAETPVSSHA
ncbi:hypothetical protein GQ53DRAFT_764143 [Thozetella sp. PMI_491]|nr:hypothetical protein GQ53DRAFT_764143 [Thozetella sp. PMI_491]